MKNRKIEKQLKRDLSVASNSDFNALMDKCKSNNVTVRERAIAGGGCERSFNRSAFRYIAIGALLLLLVGVILLTLPSITEPKPTSSGYFVIDINPSVKISYDENGALTEVAPLNEDAEVLLVGLDFSEKTPKEAVSILFERCVDLGYFSSERDNNAVLASATTDSGEQDEKMTEQIKKLFTKEFSRGKMRGVVITAVNDPSLDKKASEHGIDSQKYALIDSYLNMGGELDEAQYRDISISELYSKISEKEKELKNQRLDDTMLEHERAQKELFDTLASSVTALLDKLEACVREIDGEADDFTQEQRPKPNAEQSPHSPPPQGHNEAPRAHGKDRYEGFTKNLRDYVIELERAREASDCKRAVDGILSILMTMKENEENASLAELIDTSISEIQSLYEEFLAKSDELSALKASAEETNSARLDAFKDKPQDKHENIDDWQKEKEGEIASSWYEFKEQWTDERKNDLKGY